jgi:hypothetical protein
MQSAYQNIVFWEKANFCRQKLAKIAENSDHNIDSPDRQECGLAEICQLTAPCAPYGVALPNFYGSKLLIEKFHFGEKLLIHSRFFFCPCWIKRAGLSDFSWHNIPKRGKIYKISTKIPNFVVCNLVKLPNGRNIRNGH